MTIDTRWLRERLTGPRGTLHELIPAGYPRYARIFQPGWEIVFTPNAWRDFSSGHERNHATPVSWSEMAAEWHRVPHRQMQWGSVCRMVETSRGLADCEPVEGGRTVWHPNEGALTGAMNDALFSILLDHSPEDEVCGYAVWVGYGHMPVESNMATVDVGTQKHVVLQATLREIRTALSLEHKEEVQGPNLIWPADRSWCLSLPFNRPSSYLGGSDHLVSEILECNALETFEAHQGDDSWNDPSNDVVS